MRVYAVQQCRPFCPASKLQSNNSTKLLQKEPEAISFKKRILAGAGIGALIGFAGLSLITALSGGLAAPVAYGVYAATFGTIGGFTGNAIDELQEKHGSLDSYV